VIPVYNEEEALAAFHRQLCRGDYPLPYRFLIYYVNDGSTDQTCRARNAGSPGPAHYVPSS
jgi:glycosyltransferase involved in cell wall biosynthesis